MGIVCYTIIQKTIINNQQITLYHWLTSRKGIQMFRYFLSTMRTLVHLFPPHAYVHFHCILVYVVDPRSTMLTPKIFGVCIVPNESNVYTIIQQKCIYARGRNNWTGVQYRKYLIRCTPFLDVSQWYKLHYS